MIRERDQISYSWRVLKQLTVSKRQLKFFHCLDCEQSLNSSFDKLPMAALGHHRPLTTTFLYLAIFWIPACFEALLEVREALFKCFWRVCSKQPYCFAFNETPFYPRRVARGKGKVCILQGFSRFIVGFDVKAVFLCESLSFEKYCFKESYFDGNFMLYT